MNKRKIQLISLAVTLISAFIPAIGVNNGGYPRIFGFPAEVYHHFEPFHFNFQVLGFVFNFFFFYVLFRLLNKLFKVLVGKF